MATASSVHCPWLSPQQVPAADAARGSSGIADLRAARFGVRAESGTRHGRDVPIGRSGHAPGAAGEIRTPSLSSNSICDLLTEMGYEDVEVTQPTNDKGVDVKAVAQFGITTINEVIQVKRHRANIQRPVLDMLRGSLHRFKAQKGTIITTGDYGKGARDAAFEMGAAPIR